MKNNTLIKVFFAIIFAVIAGALTGPEATIFGVAWVRIFSLIGSLFLNALTLIVVPLVASSIITGTAHLGTDKAFGQLGLRTCFFFLLTAVIAVCVGIAVSMVFSPGAFLDPTAIPELAESEFVNGFDRRVVGGVFERIEEIFLRVIPSNIFAVASQGQMLGIIIFSLLFGFFSARIESYLSEQIINFWKAIFQVMMHMTQLIMRALPLGVFGLMAKVVATTGLRTVKPMLYFFAVVLVGLGVYIVLLFLLQYLLQRTSPMKHARAVFPALLAAFTTSSTAASLPITFECMEKRAHVPHRFCCFTLPLGISMNLTGSALYATCAVLFIAQVYGLEMGVLTLVTVFLLGVFSALGMVAGIPSASLLSVMIMIQTLGIPPEGIALVVAVDRILDMSRTAVNVYSNTCCTSLVYSRMYSSKQSSLEEVSL